MEFYQPTEQVKFKHKNIKIYKTVFLIIGFVIFFGSIIGLLSLFKKDPPKSDIVVDTSTVAKEQTVKNDIFTSVEGRYLFNGTIVMSRAVEKYAKGDYAQPFSQLNTLEPQKYDAWAADFQCPITNNVVPYEKKIANLVFNCRPEWLPELTKYVQLYNLANNHTGDQGYPEGFNETLNHLKDAGVQYFGNYDPTSALTSSWFQLSCMILLYL